MSVDASKFPPLSVTGIGLVDGLLGANCRHSIGPGDGVHNPFEHFDSEENRKREMLDQRQRLLERRIRKTRREVMTLQEAIDKAPDDATRAELEAAHRKKAALLQRQEDAYDTFCKENDLRKLYDRLEVARYGPKQAKAAEKAVKTLENGGKRSIMQDREGYARQEGFEPVIPEKYRDDFTDFEPLTLEPEEKEALAGLRRLSDESGFEYGQAKTEKGFSKVFTSSIDNGVEVPKEFLDGRSVRLFHAHTNVTPLSGMDFRLLTNPGVNRMTVIASNGDVFSVCVGDGDRPTAGEFDDVMGWLRNDVDVGMVDWPEYFDWTPQELNYMSIREQAFRIARHFKWRLEGGKL